MGPTDTSNGKAKLPDPEQGISAILKDWEMIKTLNYRHTNFRKWKQVVETALNVYVGPVHPKTMEFLAIEFNGPFPRSPMEPPVTEKDKKMYAEGLDKTKAILEAVQAELKVQAEAKAAEEEANELKNAKEGTGFQLKRVAVPKSQAPAPGGRIQATSAMDLQRHESVPTGGLKIVARAGGIIPTTMEDFIKTLDDDHEKELALLLQQVTENPEATWNDVKNVLAEIWWYRRESVQKIIPVILKR